MDPQHWLKKYVDHKTDSCDDPRQPAGPNELVSQAEEQPLLDVEPGVKPTKITSANWQDRVPVSKKITNPKFFLFKSFNMLYR